jgi:hypothetical protein
MSPSLHPASSPEGALRVREHTLIDIEQALGATSFSLVDDRVTFTRAGGRGGPAARWAMRLGDWVVRQEGTWVVVPDGEISAVRPEPAPGAPAVTGASAGRAAAR